MSTVLFARFTARAGDVARVRELLADLTNAVRAEPGNVLFEPSTLADDDRRFFVYEVYADVDAFAAHISAEHVKRFNEALGGLIEESASELTWLNPVA